MARPGGSEWETEGAHMESEWGSTESRESVLVGGSHEASRKPCGCQR